MSNAKVIIRPGDDAPTPVDSLVEGLPSDPSATISKVTELDSEPLVGGLGGISPQSAGSLASIISTVQLSQTSTQSASTIVVDVTKTFPPSITIPISNAESTLQKPHNKNAVIGSAIGVVSLLTIIALLTYYLIRRSRRGKEHDPAHVTAFEVSPDRSVEPLLQSKLQVDPISPAPNVISHNHNPSNLNPLLREILNVTQGRNSNQAPSDPSDPNVPQNIQIFIINQPSNTNGSGANEDGENSGDRYSRYLPRNMDVDTSSLPPSYE